LNRSVAMLKSDSSLKIKEEMELRNEFLQIVVFEMSTFTDVENMAGDFNLESREFVEAIEALRSWGPVFTRNIGRGDQLELLLRQMALQIVIWVDTIRKAKCKLGVFETSASHHLENVCLEIACDLAKVRKIFLSHSPFTYRLLPILQEAQYKSRQLANLKLTEWTLDSSSISTNSKHWKSRIIITDKREYWLSYAFILIVWSALKRNAKRFVWNIKSRLHLVQTKEQKLIPSARISSIISVNLLFKQRKALRYFEEQTKTNLVSGLTDNENGIIIASHFQPESSSFPIGSEYGNQVDIVFEIRRTYPDKPIFYKEHPHIYRYSIRGAISNVGVARSVDYYKTLKALGVIFLPINMDGNLFNKLSEKHLVLTISGRIAIDRSLKGLQTVVVGTPWYHGLPGTITFHDYISSKSGIMPEKDQSSKAQLWIEQAHANKTISPGPWSIFQKTFSAEGFTSDSYCKDMIELIKQAFENYSREGFQ
jgi:hypothetical protein